VVIEQAKGVIRERAGTGLAEAFVRPRNCARNHNLRLTGVAQAAIDGTLGPRAWAPPPRRPARCTLDGAVRDGLLSGPGPELTLLTLG
jgi:ANTAR domain-containing protein